MESEIALLKSAYASTGQEGIGASAALARVQRAEVLLQVVGEAVVVLLSTSTSWDQEDLANRLTVLERGLRLGRLCQRVLAEDVDL